MAVARKLAIIMHRMWVEQKDFRFGQTPVETAAEGSFRRSHLLCRGRGEGQSVTIPVVPHQARAASLDDLTRRTPSWSVPGRADSGQKRGPGRTAAKAASSGNDRHPKGRDAMRLRSQAHARE